MLSDYLLDVCVLMSPSTSQQKMKTKSSKATDHEIPISHHRRYQKLCTNERLPTLFTWIVLFGPSCVYWIGVLPELMNLLPSYLPIFILHSILFFFLCTNFILASFMDPVGRKNFILVRLFDFNFI